MRLLILAPIVVAVLLAGCATSQIGPSDYPTASAAEGAQCHAESLKYLQFEPQKTTDAYNRMMSACLEGKGHVRVGAQ